MSTRGTIIPGIPKFGQPKRTSSELNELRLYANEIMRQLYEAGERGQLDILRSYAVTAIKLLDGETNKGTTNP